MKYFGKNVTFKVPFDFFYSMQRRLLISLATRCYSQEVRVRFAPSPTGSLHIGGYRTALYNYLFAKKHKGKFLIRLEDTDQVRIVKDAAALMEHSLAWGQLIPDESPLSGGPFGPYTQSQRLSFYQEAVEVLLEQGHAYRCFCTERRLELLRKEAARNRVINKYDGHCRTLSPKEIQEKLDDKIPYTIRLKVDPDHSHLGIFQDLIFGQVDHSVFVQEGDPILMKSDGFPTYHLANVVDDHYMKISHVLRGFEWQCSTPKHILLYKVLGWTPPKYGHLSLIINPDGSKLSKRQGSVHIEHFKDQGYYSKALMNFVTITGGGFHAKSDTCDLPELIDSFDLELLKTNSSQMNFELLDDINKQVIQEKLQNSPEEILQEAKKVLETIQVNNLSDSELMSILVWGQDRMTKISDLLTLPDFTFIWARPSSIQGCDLTLNKNAVKETIETIFKHEEFQDANKAIRKLSKTYKVPYPALMKCVRIFLSGNPDGPPVKDMLERLGKSEAKHRLKIGLEKYLENI